jgi:hypothetical protein
VYVCFAGDVDGTFLLSSFRAINSLHKTSSAAGGKSVLLLNCIISTNSKVAHKKISL